VVICRQHGILEGVTKDAGEFPIEVKQDIELRQATAIMNKMGNSSLMSPHIELDHGVMREGKGKKFQDGLL
jgi:hypothetical protein